MHKVRIEFVNRIKSLKQHLWKGRKESRLNKFKLSLVEALKTRNKI